MNNKNSIINAIWKKLEEKHNIKNYNRILSLPEYNHGKETMFNHGLGILLNKTDIVKQRIIPGAKTKTIVRNVNSLCNFLYDFESYNEQFNKQRVFKKYNDIKSEKNKRIFSFLKDIENYIKEK